MYSMQKRIFVNELKLGKLQGYSKRTQDAAVGHMARKQKKKELEFFSHY